MIADRSRPIAPLLPRIRRSSMAAPPIALSLRWCIHKGPDALDARIEALRPLRAGTLRARAVVAAASLAEETAARPSAQDVRDALAMLSRRYVVRNSPEDQRNISFIAAAAAAMEGRQVHLVQLAAQTAQATAEAFAPIARRLGLTVTCLDEDADLDTRALAYRSDIVIASANRLTRDLLRERIVHGQRGRGTRAAISRLAAREGNDRLIWPDDVTGIVMDADLMLFDTPRPVAVSDELEREKGRVLADQAFMLISGMDRDTHYVIDTATRRIRLTPKGRDRIDTYATLFGGVWLDHDWCETTVLAAITVRDLFAPDSDYVVGDGGVQLARATADGVDGPSITDLVSAKEALPSKRGELHLADIRRLMANYSVLGATGYAVEGFERELSAGFDLRRAGGMVALPRSLSATFIADREAATAHLAARLGDLDGDVTVWTPVAREIGGQTLADPPVVGTDLFAAPPVNGRILQFGAAPAHWEARLANLVPGLKIEQVLSPADPWFALLPPDAGARRAFAAKPDGVTYAAAQSAEAHLRHEKRMSALASDSFFDRILAFTGDMGW